MTKVDTLKAQFIQILDYCYEAAVNGLPAQESVFDLAQNYLQEDGTLEEQIDRLIRNQTAKSAATGFLTGLGGILTLPVAVPADLAATYFIQVRMIGAIAVMRGYDIHSDQMKTLIYLALCGDGVREALKDIGVTLGKKLTEAAIKQISGATLNKINSAVGFRLLTKAGETGLINFSKGIPLVGGLIGAGVNGYSTDLVGEAAKKIFGNDASRTKNAVQTVA